MNVELQITTTDFLTVATSTIKELEEKLEIVELEKERLLLIVSSMNNTEWNDNKCRVSGNSGSDDNDKDTIHEISKRDNINDNGNDDCNTDIEKVTCNEINTIDNANSNDDVQMIDTSIPFSATKIESSSGNCYIQCITAMSNYHHYSQEEIRFATLNKME